MDNENKLNITELASVCLPINKGELTEITTDHEFMFEDKDWFHEQFFINEKGELVAKFVQYGSKIYAGRAEQLSRYRQDIFIIYGAESNVEERDNKDNIQIVQVVNCEHKLLHTYDYIESGEEDGTFQVRKNKLYGFIDINGVEIIKPQYSRVYSFEEGVAVVWPTENKKCGLINKKNKVLVPFMYDDTTHHFRGMVDGYIVFCNHDFDKKPYETTSYIYDKNYKLVLEYKGEVKNLAHGIFAFETERNTYEIRKLNENDK